MRTPLLIVSLLVLGMLPLKAQDSVSVTFSVDMRVQILKEAFSISTHSMSLRGSFNGWGQTPMTDADNDSIYTVTIDSIAKNSDITYKFFYGPGDVWESRSDRPATIGTADTTLPTVFFNDEAMPSGDSTDVTFEVDMRLPAKSDANWATREVYVAGNFTNWASGAKQMADGDNDSIYVLTVRLTSGQLLKYKFIHSADTTGGGAITWESVPDRKHWVIDGAQTISKFWDDQDPNVTLADGDITFEVDMTVADSLGVFDPNVDSVQIRGVFNGWNATSEPAKALMNQDIVNPNRWFINIPFTQWILDDSLAYKYYIKRPTGVPEYSNTGWEVPIGSTITGDRNRVLVFEGITGQVAPVEYFENIHADWFIPTGTTVEANFSVDMKPAMVQAPTAFNPATDTVYWIPRQPLFYAINGLTWSLEQRMLRMTDANSDSIYTGTLTLDGPAFNGFLYQYAFKTASSWIQEDGSQGQSRVRFVGQPAANQFTTPYDMPEDVWTNGEKPEETAPLVTSVEKVSATPRTYALAQNYPNPFNPSTTITFEIAAKELVTLKIFNLLGQEVATLVNEELAPGVYTAKFDGKRLSSGVYIYRISAGSFTQVRKMMFLK